MSRTSRAGPWPRSPLSQAVHCPFAVQPQARCSGAAERTALRHYSTPCEMRFQPVRTPRSYVPWLHGRYPFLRYYGRSDPGRPFRRRPPWFPDSRLADFHPCCLQPSAVLCPTRSTALNAGRSISFGLRLYLAAARTAYRMSSLCPPHRTDAVTDWWFTSSCSPPGVAPMQLPSVTGSTVRPAGTHPVVPVCFSTRPPLAGFEPSLLSRSTTTSASPSVSSGISVQNVSNDKPAGRGMAHIVGALCLTLLEENTTEWGDEGTEEWTSSSELCGVWLSHVWLLIFTATWRSRPRKFYLAGPHS
jgi:hypothetical protein